MSDFVPADLITIEIGGRQKETFIEDIDFLPSRIRGAWFVSSSEKGEVSVVIEDPIKNVIFERDSKKEGIFYFEARRRGPYFFNFINPNVIESLQVTFALHSGNSSDEILSSKHLTPIEEKLLNVDKSLKDL